MQCSKCNSHNDTSATFCANCGAELTPKDPLIGQRLGEKYVLQKRLGEGGFGAVYQAEERRFERKVAIKILHQSSRQSPDALARFRQEWLALSQITHYAALKLYDVGQTDEGLVWMATEFLEGETLEALSQREGKISLTSLIQILQPICEVLEEAHKKGIIHRDLKPANIFLARTGEKTTAKLLDFGLAKLSSRASMTQEGIALGTPKYMAPEQWEGAKSATAASDVYSLGIIVYQLLSGRLPWSSEQTQQLTFYTKPPLPLNEAMIRSACPDTLNEAVMKALSREPSKRQASPMELLNILRATQEGPPKPEPITQNKTKKKPWVLIALPLLLLVAVLIWVSQEKPPKQTTDVTEVSSAYIKEALTQCEQGQARSCYTTASYYESEKGDADKAFALRSRACELDPTAFCSEFGLRYMQDPARRKQAKKTLKQACEKSSMLVCSTLAEQKNQE